MKTLIFLSGFGTIVGSEVEPVEFTAGDCVLMPAAFQGVVHFAGDTEYLTVTL